MTTKTDAMLTRLDRVLEQLEALGLTAPPPTATPASVNANGTPGPVAAGELIEAAWGNATANSISRLWGYPIVARAFKGAVTTNGNGDFAVVTGFVPVAAFAISAQTTNPATLVLTTLDATQAVFRAYALPSGVAQGSATIAVSYMILAAPGAAGSLTAEPLELEP